MRTSVTRILRLLGGRLRVKQEPGGEPEVKQEGALRRLLRRLGRS